MSLAFNDTTTSKGIVQIYEKEIGADPGFISGNTTRLKAFTADVNLAMDDYLAIAIPSSGTWQFDDSNHADFNTIKTNLVSGQRDYTFTTDETGNLILDIYKVAILPSASATLFTELDPMDEFNDRDNDIISENTATEVPSRYAKTANGIILDTPTSYNATLGLKVYINREASYFTYSDTTKKPGCPGLHHRYFAIKPALDHARRNNLSNFAQLRDEVVSFEGDPERGVTGSIERYFSHRERDKRHLLTGEPICFE